MSELLKINVNEHVEKKNGLTYLSWAWAWAEVLKADPLASWSVVEFDGLPFRSLPDATAMVKVVVQMKANVRECWLPVMNHRNQAIKNPDAFAINTAIMRCLAKAIAMHGLGLYIYAGEDLPEETEAKVIAPARLSADEAATLLDDDTKESLFRDLDEVLTLAETGKTTQLIAWYYALPSNEHKILAWAEIPSQLRTLLKKNQPEKQ